MLNAQVSPELDRTVMKCLAKEPDLRWQTARDLASELTWIARFGQFCIDLKLAAAMRGEVSRGLFFRGASKLPFGDAMRSVRELMDYLLNGRMPTAA